MVKIRGATVHDVLRIADEFSDKGSGLPEDTLELTALEDDKMWFTREQVEEIIEHLQRALAGPLGKLVIQAEKETK